jgi:hypothetical protein
MESFHRGASNVLSMASDRAVPDPHAGRLLVIYDRSLKLETGLEMGLDDSHRSRSELIRDSRSQKAAKSFREIQPLPGRRARHWSCNVWHRRSNSAANPPAATNLT